MEETVKVIGKRKEAASRTPEEAHAWLETVVELRGNRGVCPRGLYRFNSFEEADQWMIEMLARCSLGLRR